MRTSVVASWAGGVTAIVLVGIGAQAYGARPLVVDDADPVVRGRVEVEFGTELRTGGNFKALAAPLGVVIGLAHWLEVGFGTSALYVDDEEASPRRVAGVGDLVLAAKARLLVLPFDFDLSIAPALKIPTAGGDRGLGTGKVDGSLILIATKEFTEDHKFHFNLGYTLVGQVRERQLRDVLLIGMAGETPIPGLAAERLRLVAELFGTTKAEADGRGDIQGRLGLRYLLIDDLVLDAAVGRSLSARPPVEFFATVGLIWTFDAPWKPRRRQ